MSEKRLPTGLYGSSLALLTDVYQLTMALGYWKCGRAEDEAVFQLFFRENPFGGGYSISAGLAYVLDYVEGWKVDESDLSYLRTLEDSAGGRLLPDDFLAYLAKLHPEVDIEAIPEGRPVFPGEPLLRVSGPLAVCQLLETALLNMVNFQTLIATKASRVCLAAGKEPVLEFGLRRAQGIDGGVAVSRAAYIGGVAATSNLLAGKLLGIPVRGTHGHSWVMAFSDETSAFAAYAKAMPDNCLFLVDTYDTITGVRRAIEAAKVLRAEGRRFLGVRLDSGDMGKLTVEVRRLLDQDGFDDAQIVVSGDLDEERIGRLKQAGVPVSVWGVGTRLATAFGQPALGGVYKMAAVKNSGVWRYPRKISDDPAKTSSVGVFQVRRWQAAGRFLRDLIHDVSGATTDGTLLPEPDSGGHGLDQEGNWEDLLVPAMRGGRPLGGGPTLSGIRERAMEELARLPDGVTSLVDPVTYPCEFVTAKGPSEES